MSRLSKLSAPSGSWDSKDNVYDVSSQHTLSQAAGYLKFALSEEGPVYFRGQAARYPTMSPSLFRGSSLLKTLRNRVNDLGAFRNDVRRKSAFISGTPDYAHDPILQHYGIKTPWLDLVDNLWVALWFACHAAVAHGPRGEYIHFERRRRSATEYAYVALVQCGKLTPVPRSPGLARSDAFEVVDLRVAAPSLYLRPHAQHGLLMRRQELNTAADSDLSSCVVGWLRMSLSDALRWLGRGGLLQPHGLFPPPKFDRGYDRLLTHAPKATRSFLGSVFHVGA